MIMKIIRNMIFAVAALIGVATACTQHEDIWSAEDAAFVTKVDMGQQPGDMLTVLDGFENLSYQVKSVGTVTTFTGEGGLNADATDVFAVFPYDENASRYDMSVIFNVPSVQEAVKNGVYRDANRFAAYSSNLLENTSLEFVPMVSYLRLKFDGSDNIRSVVLKSITEEFITGTVKATLTDLENPYIVFIDGSDNVTLTSEEVLDGYYTIALVPSVLQNGLEVKMTNDQGQIVTKKIICRDENGVVSAMQLIRGKVNGYDISFDSVELDWNYAVSLSIDKKIYNDVRLSWTCEGTPSSFRIMIGGVQYAVADGSARSLSITDLNVGYEGKVTVVAVYPDGSELTSNEELLKTLSMDLNIDKVFWSDAWISWVSLVEPANYKVMLDGVKVAEVPGSESAYHLTGLPNGHTGKLQVISVMEDGTESASDEIDFRTGEITQLTKNVSPTSVSFNVENMTGSYLTLTTPALLVELYDGADPETSNKIMGEYVLNLQEPSEGTPFRTSAAVSPAGSFQELNITFGPLQSDTQYWVRVKCVDSYTTKSNNTKKDFTVTSAAGTSEFSSMQPLRTAKEHVPGEKEIIFQGFDEMTCMYDYINVAVGAFPNYLAAGKTKAGMTCSAIQNWTGGYDFSTLLPLSQLAHIGWISQQNSSDDVFTLSSSKTIATGLPSAGSKIYTFKADCGKIAGWYVTNNSYKCAGYVEIGKHYNSDTQQGMLATPKLPEGKLSAEEAKACVVSFKGLVLYGDACDLKIWVYDAASKSWSEKQTIAIENSSGTTAKVTSYSAYDPEHKWYEHSCELDLKAGDIVAFAAPKGSATLLDDICINLK